MTGSGTLVDPYVIWNVNDLQDIELDPLAHYELGQDIDASATVGWHAGAGFYPIGPFPIRRPTGDHSSAGVWTVFPAAPPTKFDKVDEVITDEDATYIESANGTALFTIPAFSIPAGSTRIGIRILSRVRKTGADGKITTVLQVGGNSYGDTTTHNVGQVTYSDKSGNWVGKNPATGLDWTVDQINGIGANALEAIGFKTSAANVRVTQCRATVFQSVPNSVQSFDGKGHKISDLHINRPSFHSEGAWGVGIYSEWCGGNVSNLEMENVDIIGSDDPVGAFASVFFGTESCGITNSKVSGSITGPAAPVWNHVGGFIGETYNYHSATERVTLSDCEANVILAGASIGGMVGRTRWTDFNSCVTQGTINGVDNCGGIAGEHWDGSFSQCHSSMTIIADDYGGGLAGYLVNSGGYSTTRCYATGNVSGDDNLGGLVGYNENDIEQCYATGNVIGTGSCVGGLIGLNGGNVTDCYARGDAEGVSAVGGLIGEHWGPGTVDNCYSTGLVTGVGPNIGGLIGADSVVTDSFWDTVTSGQAASAGGTGKTTAEMKTAATFTDAGWDFATIWTICGGVNNNYPCLVGLTPSCVLGPVIPTVTTNPASAIGHISAILNSLLDDDGGEACECGFEWGLTPAYGSVTPTQSRVTGLSSSQIIYGLFPGTTYHFRAFATNSVGTGYGADKSFISTPAFNRAHALSREEI